MAGGSCTGAGLVHTSYLAHKDPSAGRGRGEGAGLPHTGQTLKKQPLRVALFARGSIDGVYHHYPSAHT